MLPLIKRIIAESGYYLNERSNQDNLLFEKQNKEYFLIADYSEDEISDFFSNEKTKSLLSFFEDLKKTISGIEKNTSLIICLKVNNLQDDTERLKNLLYKIEEDEYFFKKYVITYTDNSISTLVDSDTIINTIHKKILEPGRFDQFRNDYFFDDEYFVVIQLFVKIPFLRFEQGDLEFQNLSEVLDTGLTEMKLHHIEDVILSSNIDPEKIFLGGKEYDEELNQFIESFQSQDDES